MPLTWDTNGQLVPPGKVEKTLDEPFLMGALPSWLTTPLGTASYGATASTRGYLQVTTGTANGNQARVAPAFSQDLASVVALRWEAFGLALDSTVLSVGMGIGASGNVGAFMRQDSAAGETTAVISMAGSAAAVPYTLLEATKRRNLAIILLPTIGGGGEFYVLEDDQVMAYRKYSGLTLGAVTPDLTITTRESAAHLFQVSRLRYTIWSD